MALAVAQRAEGTRVLIVPDDLLTHELGGSLLDREALIVRAADSAEDALAIRREWRPHLIVLRSQIGGHSIAQLCQELRAGTEGDDAPRLLLVTDSIGERMGEAADALCDAHLVSPVEPACFVSTIAELLDLHVRRSSRAPIDALVHAEGFDQDVAIDACVGTALNLSEDGLLLESGRPLPVGSSGKLLFFLPGANERLSLHGVVRTAVDEVRLWFAIELVDLAPHHRALIRRYVEQVLQP